MTELSTILKTGSWLYVGAVLLFALWESFWPKVPLVLSAPRRWSIHFCLSLLPQVLNYFLPGTAIVLLAVAVRTSPWGVLNHPAIPLLLQAIITILALDLVTYWRHRFNHAIPLGWRLHLLHHSDRDFDFTDGFRFHPLETILTLSVQALTVVILAPPPVAVALTAILFSLNSIYAHANVGLPEWLEHPARLVFITPGLHRIHHLEEDTAQQSNFGDLFSFWDRLFGTLREESESIRPDGPVGVREVPAERSAALSHIAGAPFGS